MARSILILLGGAAVGALVALWLAGSKAPDGAPERFANLPKVREVVVERRISVEEARTLREDAYASITTVEDTLALPTDFDQTEALFVLAGRSDAAAVQDLISQANGIADPAKRTRAIGILLSRLTDLDPRSALAIARSPALASLRGFEYEVWAAWSHQDLQAALDEAASLSGTRRNRAVQGIYRGFRLPDANTVAELQMLLGSEPDNTTLSGWLGSLYDDSPADAVAFIEALPSKALQDNAVWVLAYRIAQSGAMSAGARFSSPRLQQVFDNRFSQQLSQVDPERAMDRYFANPGNRQSIYVVYQAMRKIATADSAKALSIYGRLEGEARNYAIQAIGEAMLASDPEGALAWARENDESPDNRHYIELIGKLAVKDPDRAIAHVMEIESAQRRDTAFRKLAVNLALSDPGTARQLIDRIQGSSTRQLALLMAMHTVSTSSIDEALEFYDTLPPQDRDGLLGNLVGNIASQDPEKALGLIARMAPEEATRARYSIIEAVAEQRSFDNTMAFIERFREEPEFVELRSTVLRQLGYREPERALQYAEQHLSGQAYEAVVASSAQQIVASNPGRALALVSQLSDPETRSQTTQGVVRHWLETDPPAATDWLSSQPSGEEKDQMLQSVMYATVSNPQLGMRLLNQVSNPAYRENIARNMAMNLYWSQPAVARQYLDAAGMDDEAKRQFEERMRRQHGAGALRRY